MTFHHSRPHPRVLLEVVINHHCCSLLVWYNALPHSPDHLIIIYQRKEETGDQEHLCLAYCFCCGGRVLIISTEKSLSTWPPIPSTSTQLPCVSWVCNYSCPLYLYLSVYHINMLCTAALLNWVNIVSFFAGPRSFFPSCELDVKGFCTLTTTLLANPLNDSGDDFIIHGTKKPYEKPIDFTQIQITRLPTVFILGRPNVGKSALFNRWVN